MSHKESVIWTQTCRYAACYNRLIRVKSRHAAKDDTKPARHDANPSPMSHEASHGIVLSVRLIERPHRLVPPTAFNFWPFGLDY